MPSFRELLKNHIERLGISQAEFARRAGVDPGTITHLLTGKHGPDWHRAETWADLLGLAGAAREVFCDAMCLAASPPRIQTLVSRLERRAKRRGR